MLKQLRDLTIYEARQIANKHCVMTDSWDETCSKCPFNSEEEQKENCPLCNGLFNCVRDLSEKDLDKVVEVDDDYVSTIWSDGLEVAKIEDKDAKIRQLQAEITKLLANKQYLKDKITRFKVVVGGQQRTIEDLLED